MNARRAIASLSGGRQACLVGRTTVQTHLSPSMISTRFFDINVSRFSIIPFSGRRFGHNRLPAHVFRLNLNSFPYCRPRRNEILVCDFRRIIFWLSFSARGRKYSTTIPSSSVLIRRTFFYSPPFCLIRGVNVYVVFMRASYFGQLKRVPAG